MDQGGANCTFNTSFFPAASNAAASDVNAVILTTTTGYTGRMCEEKVKLGRMKKRATCAGRRKLTSMSAIALYLNVARTLSWLGVCGSIKHMAPHSETSCFGR
jgi:hypothetical protein